MADDTPKGLTQIENTVAEIGTLVVQRMSEIERYRSVLEKIAEMTSDPGVERLARAALEE